MREFYRAEGIKINYREDQSVLLEKCRKATGAGKDYKYLTIIKKSLDARDKGNIVYVYTAELRKTPCKLPQPKPIERCSDLNEPIAVIGAGPCGLLCALYLARAGLKPILIERGECVEDRIKRVKGFFNGDNLDTESNVQFGEGGAGAFSDGKLNTGVDKKEVKEALSEFVRAGAPEEILYLSRPHIGSDRLPDMVKNIRKEIISLGGSVRFNEKLQDLKVEGGKLKKIVTSGGEMPVSAAVIAVGHSARDTFSMLFERGVFMESKDFAVGFRIEHLQRNIDIAQYGKENADSGLLPPAEYRLTASSGGRGIYTFCMCPGGSVVAAASEEGGVVVNGMSNYARNLKNANSAVVAQVGSKDYGEGIFDGINFQRKTERLAYELSGGGYRAPCQLVGDFLKGKKSSGFKEILPSYPLGTSFISAEKIYDEKICSSLKEGILQMGRKLKGFDCEGAVMTFPETRTSSPIKVARDEFGESINVKNLYPAGEGCGYAGGIASAAADGIRAARHLIERFKEN